MTMFSGPEQHAATPPESWKIMKEKGSRVWTIMAGDTQLDSYPTRKAAQEAMAEGTFYTALYEKEGRWYAGDTPYGWKDYVPASTFLNHGAIPGEEAPAREHVQKVAVKAYSTALSAYNHPTEENPRPTSPEALTMAYDALAQAYTEAEYRKPVERRSWTQITAEYTEILNSYEKV